MVHYISGEVPFTTAQVLEGSEHAVLRLKDTGGQTHHLVIEKLHSPIATPDGMLYTADVRDAEHKLRYTLTVWVNQGQMSLATRQI